MMDEISFRRAAAGSREDLAEIQRVPAPLWRWRFCAERNAAIKER